MTWCAAVFMIIECSGDMGVCMQSTTPCDQSTAHTAPKALLHTGCTCSHVMLINALGTE